MASVTIQLLHPLAAAEFYFHPDQVGLARRMLKEKRIASYRTAGTMGVTGKEGLEAAEELFDLTNNPARYEERCEQYGRQRSLSVGDVLNVDGVRYVCLPVGWAKL